MLAHAHACALPHSLLHVHCLLGSFWLDVAAFKPMQVLGVYAWHSSVAIQQHYMP
jgi:hypothetical protein